MKDSTQFRSDARDQVIYAALRHDTLPDPAPPSGDSPMLTSDSRTQTTLMGGRGDQVLGQPEDAALAEQWHNAEIRTRILKLVFIV